MCCAQECVDKGEAPINPYTHTHTKPARIAVPRHHMCGDSPHRMPARPSDDTTFCPCRPSRNSVRVAHVIRLRHHVVISTRPSCPQPLIRRSVCFTTSAECAKQGLRVPPDNMSMTAIVAASRRCACRRCADAVHTCFGTRKAAPKASLTARPFGIQHRREGGTPDRGCTNASTSHQGPPTRRTQPKRCVSHDGGI